MCNIDKEASEQLHDESTFVFSLLVEDSIWNKTDL